MISNLNTLKTATENLKGVKNAQKNYFRKYIITNLGLNNSNEKVKKILNNYNKYPNYINNHMSKANTLKALKLMKG